MRIIKETYGNLKGGHEEACFLSQQVADKALNTFLNCLSAWILFQINSNNFRKYSKAL